MGYDAEVDFGGLVGKRIRAVVGLEVGSDTVYFDCQDGSAYVMYHRQDCCENVSVEEVVGDVADLFDAEVLSAEESANTDNPPECNDDFLWTFYRITTSKGLVVIRWLGTSNGYYGVNVSFEKAAK